MSANDNQDRAGRLLRPVSGSADVEHRLIRGAECYYGNSGYGFHEGYDFYSCSCGKWGKAYKDEQSAVVAHHNHAQRGRRELDLSDAWTHGYYCAVANLIRKDGVSAQSIELFREGGNPNMADETDKEIFRKNGLLPNEKGQR